MKNLFTITESEKERILGLHEQVNTLAQGNDLTNSTLNTGNKFNVASTVPKIVSSATPEQKKLIDAANSWIKSNQTTIPKTVAEISKFLADKVTAKQLTPEALPYVKAAIQSNSKGTLVFPKEETGGQPATSTPINFKTKNPKIEALQTILVNKYKKNIGTSGVNKNGVDGILGAKTITAVKEVLATKLGGQVQGGQVQGGQVQGGQVQGGQVQGGQVQGGQVQGSQAQEVAPTNPEDIIIQPLKS
jgi:hypothetical protein